MSNDTTHTTPITPARLAAVRALALAAPPSLYAESDPGATCDECGEHMAGEGAAILRTPGEGGALLVLSGDGDAATLAFHREAREVVLGLLGHVEALAGPLPDDGGEALGRLAWEVMPPSAFSPPWEEVAEPIKARYRAIALTIYQRGHAAGRSEGEAERADAAKLALFVNGALSDECIALRAIAADPKAHTDEAVAREKALHDLEVASLTAELAEARGATEHARMDVKMTAALQEMAEHDASVARRDGAREERRLCLMDIEDERLAAPDRGYVARVVARIRARGEGGGR